jgi:hypothetical protein
MRSNTRNGRSPSNKLENIVSYTDELTNEIQPATFDHNNNTSNQERTNRYIPFKGKLFHYDHTKFNHHILIHRVLVQYREAKQAQAFSMSVLFERSTALEGRKYPINLWQTRKRHNNGGCLWCAGLCWLAWCQQRWESPSIFSRGHLMSFAVWHASVMKEQPKKRSKGKSSEIKMRITSTSN